MLQQRWIDMQRLLLDASLEPATGLHIGSFSISPRHAQAYREFPVVRMVGEPRCPHSSLRSPYAVMGFPEVL